MDTILSQITSLLVEPSGSMVYHLVIAFIFISILQPALSFIPEEDGSDKRKRLLVGITLLIASRLVVFAFSLAAITQDNPLGDSLGVIEMAILAFDLVIISWLFAFPEEHRAADIGLTIFALGILTAGVVSAIYWSLNGQSGELTQSTLGLGWQAITIGITVIGLVTLILSKTAAKLQGIIMLVFVLGGEVIQLAVPMSGGDLLPISRLSHLVAFPLLVGILQNYFPQPEEEVDTPYQSFVPVEFTPEMIEEMKKEEEIDLPSMVTAPLDMLVVENAPKISRDPVGSASQALDLHIYQNGLAMAAATTPRQTCQLFTRLTAHALVADLCLLLTPPDQNKQVHLVCGYDLIVQETLQSTSFDSSLIPRYEKLFNNGRPIHVLDQGSEAMHDFARLLQVENVNNLLAYPALNEEGQVIAAVVLVSPYSKHVWDANDQEYLQTAGPTINAVLQKALAPQQNVRELENLQTELALSNTDKQELLSEKEQLEKQITNLTEQLSQKSSPREEELAGEKDRLEKQVLELTQRLAHSASPKEMDELKEKQAVLESNLKVLGEENAALEEENQTLEERLANLVEKSKALAEEHAKLLDEKDQAADATQMAQDIQAQIDALNNANEDLAKEKAEISKQNEEMAVRMAELTEENRTLILNLNQLETSVSNVEPGEDPEALQDALEQAQNLEHELAEAKEALDALMSFRTSSNGDLFPEEQAEVIASISQELRQPLSSISGYTDLLISESVGILGALQKKFLERVKASTERMHQLIDDLIQVSTLDTGKYLFSVQPMELFEVIDTVIETTSTQFRDKQISLRVDIAPELPKMHTDKDALQQIMLHLMNNAGAATPPKGEILLKAQMYDKTEDDVILLSVTDTGEGIPKEDLPRVFSRLYRADNPLIEGVGDTGVGLSIAKTLTEALGGRIWVESLRGTGSTYSVLLPVTSPALSSQEG
jgi:signal transduction histidine kinase